MKKTVLLVLLSLHCSSLISCASGCNLGGPEACTFYVAESHSLCSWSTGGSYDFSDEGNDHNYCLGLGRDGEGMLTSRIACSTEGQPHCLFFEYKIKRNNAIFSYLSVSIQYEGTDEVESMRWIMSSSNGWVLGLVPISTFRNFTVVFRAKTRPINDRSVYNYKVFIDDIAYSHCDLDLQPPEANPTTTTISTTWKTTTQTRRITSPLTDPPTTTMATTVNNGTTSEISRPTPSSTSARISAVRTITTSENIDDNSDKVTSKTVGLIVGGIVAALVVIIIVASVLLVVFRRKHIQLWKVCCRKKKHKEQLQMNASQNAANSIDADDPGYANGILTNHTQQNCDSHRLEALTFTPSSAHHSYENTPPNDPSEPVYAAVNKPQQVSQETPPENQRKPNSTVYEMCNEEAATCDDDAGTEYQNLPPTMAKQEQDGQNNSSSPLPTLPSGYNLAQPQNSSSVYHILEKEPGTDSNSVHHVPNASVTTTALGEDGEYNKLDFDRKDRGETNSFDQEKTERATGGVYSHLNEGDGNTYNEVHREKRDEVIDGVYSHIK